MTTYPTWITYRNARAGVRWTMTWRLRRRDRQWRERAQAGDLGGEGTVHLAAIRNELLDRGEHLEPVERGSSTG